GVAAPGSPRATVANPTCFFFFFQAEDGIRDFHVTGVQTCALPISLRLLDHLRHQAVDLTAWSRQLHQQRLGAVLDNPRGPLHPLGHAVVDQAAHRDLLAPDGAPRTGPDVVLTAVLDLELDRFVLAQSPAPTERVVCPVRPVLVLLAVRENLDQHRAAVPRGERALVRRQLDRAGPAQLLHHVLAPAVEHTTGRVEPSPRFVLVIQIDAQVEADRDEHAALLHLAERAHLVGLGAGESDRFGPEPGDVLLHLADGPPHDVAAESLLHRGARVWAERSLLHRTFRRDSLGQLQIDQRAGVDSPQRREHSDLTAILRPLGLLRRRGRRRSDLPRHGLACHGGTTTRGEQTQSDDSNERPQHESPRPFQSRDSFARWTRSVLGKPGWSPVRGIEQSV